MQRNDDWKSLDALEKEGEKFLESCETRKHAANDMIRYIEEEYSTKCKEIREDNTPIGGGIALPITIFFIIASISVIRDGHIIEGIFWLLVSSFGTLVAAYGAFFSRRDNLTDAREERNSAIKTQEEKIEEMQQELPVDMDRLLQSYYKAIGRQEEHNQELTRLACRVIGTRHDLTTLQKTGKISALNQFKETIDAAIQRTLMRFIGVNELFGRLVMYDNRVKQPEIEVPSYLKDEQKWYEEDATKCSKWEEEIDLAASSLNKVRIQLVRYEQSEEEAKMRILNAGLLPAWQELQAICEALDEIIDLSDPVAAFDRKLAEAS